MISNNFILRFLIVSALGLFNAFTYAQGIDPSDMTVSVVPEKSFNYGTGRSENTGKYSVEVFKGGKRIGSEHPSSADVAFAKQGMLNSQIELAKANKQTVKLSFKNGKWVWIEVVQNPTKQAAAGSKDDLTATLIKKMELQIEALEKELAQMKECSKENRPLVEEENSAKH